MTAEEQNALIAEAKDGLSAGGSVQILLKGYGVWLEITELWNLGPLLKARLSDSSFVLIAKESLIAARFGEVVTEV